MPCLVNLSSMVKSTPGDLLQIKNFNCSTRTLLLTLQTCYSADMSLCPMRSSEICKLKANQVHLDAVMSQMPPRTADFISLDKFDPKTGTQPTIPVSAELKEVLARRLEGLAPDDYVFTTEEGRIFSNVTVASRLKNLCKKVGIPYGDKLVAKKGNRLGIVFHCLRRTRTTKWVELGYSDELVRTATGHRSLEAYRQYVKPGPAALMRLVGGGGNKHTEPARGAAHA